MMNSIVMMNTTCFFVHFDLCISARGKFRRIYMALWWIYKSYFADV